MKSVENPDELYKKTTVGEIRRWLNDLGEVQRAQNHGLTDWEMEFVNSVREQANKRIAKGAQKPLSGNQLVHLKSIWEEKT